MIHDHMAHFFMIKSGSKFRDQLAHFFIDIHNNVDRTSYPHLQYHLFEDLFASLHPYQIKYLQLYQATNSLFIFSLELILPMSATVFLLI